MKQKTIVPWLWRSFQAFEKQVVIQDWSIISEIYSTAIKPAEGST